MASFRILQGEVRILHWGADNLSELKSGVHGCGYVLPDGFPSDEAKFLALLNDPKSYSEQLYAKTSASESIIIAE